MDDAKSLISREDAQKKDPNPPVPIINTEADFIFFCPSRPTSGINRCLEYRSISEWDNSGFINYFSKYKTTYLT